MQPFIAPSILSANFACLGEEVNNVLEAGADIIHFDVMDNHFVPNLTIGPLVCESLRAYGVNAPIDVHLMTEPVDSLIKDFANAGATYITFHPEASKHPHRSLALIKELGCQSGLVLSPGTPLSYLEHLIDELDMVLIMSVNPGFAGQKMVPSALKKIANCRNFLDQHGINIPIEVDGNVSFSNIPDMVAAGADILVAGTSSIFNKDDDYSENMDKIEKAIQRGLERRRQI